MICQDNLVIKKGDQKATFFWLLECYLIDRFTALGPFGPSCVSNVTASPSFNECKPAASTAEICTKTSLFSQVMNPKPLEALNHFPWV